MPFTFNDRQKSVAFFLLTGVFFILVLIVLVASGSDLVTFKQKHYTYFNDSHGFTGGTNIKYKGFNVGKIQKISLTRDNKIKADLYFYKKYKYLIKKESVLRVQSSLLGSASLVLISNDFQTDLIEPKALVFSSDMPEGQDVLVKYNLEGKAGDEMTDKVKIILDDIHDLKPFLEGTLTSLTDTMNNVSGMVAGVREKKEVEQIIDLLKSTITEMRSLIQTVQKALGKR